MDNKPFGYWCKFADGSEEFRKTLPINPDFEDMASTSIPLYAGYLQEEPVAVVRWQSICGINPPMIHVNTLIPPEDLYDGMKLYARLEKKECP